MADTEAKSESLIEKVPENVHSHDSSSSTTTSSKVKPKAYRLLGREQPIHKCLGGGKAADAFLWRNKKVSALAIGGATAIWVFFELLHYHLLTLVCHILMAGLAVFFFWSKASNLINRSPPQIPEVKIPEDVVWQLVSIVRTEISEIVANVRDVASGKELKKFFAVVTGLWLLSVVGSSYSFVSLFYIASVVLFTVPFLYEKYEVQVDCLAQKAGIEIRRQYAVLSEKVLSKIHHHQFGDKKKA